MNNKTYGTLCALYYDLDDTKNDKNEMDFYRQYLQEAQGPILEPMCGTGRLLIPFLKEGFNIEGFDISDQMLELLYKKAFKEQLNPSVWKAIIENKDKTNRYALAFIALGSFNLITKMTNIENSLKALYQSLLKDGKLVFEVMTTEFFKKQEINKWIYTALPCSDGKIIALATIHEKPEKKIQKTRCTYVLCENDIPVKTEEETYSIRFYDFDELDTLLEKIGFLKIKKIKAFKYGIKADVTDKIIIYECTK